MINGLYSVRFRSNTGSEGSGVVICIDDKVYGGDASYFYKGDVSTEGEDISGHMQVARHQPGDSIFGPLGNFKLDLSGTRQGNSFTLQGGVAGQSDLKIIIDGKKIADL